MKYRLTVSGDVEFDEECGRDERTKQVLLGNQLLSKASQVEVAIQEMREEAGNRTVELIMEEEKEGED